MIIKQCFKCNERKAISEFYRHKKMADGHLGKCKECTKLDVRRHRRANALKIRAYDVARHVGERARKNSKRAEEYRKRNPQIAKAHAAVTRAVRAGRLVRLPCEVCGRIDSHGHHDDYSKPLEVRWLCPPHHAEAHGRLGPV